MKDGISKIISHHIRKSQQELDFVQIINPDVTEALVLMQQLGLHSVSQNSRSFSC